MTIFVSPKIHHQTQKVHPRDVLLLHSTQLLLILFWRKFLQWLQLWFLYLYIIFNYNNWKYGSMLLIEHGKLYSLTQVKNKWTLLLLMGTIQVYIFRRRIEPAASLRIRHPVTERADRFLPAKMTTETRILWIFFQNIKPKKRSFEISRPPLVLKLARPGLENSYLFQGAVFRNW